MTDDIENGSLTHVSLAMGAFHPNPDRRWWQFWKPRKKWYFTGYIEGPTTDDDPINGRRITYRVSRYPLEEPRHEVGLVRKDG